MARGSGLGGSGETVKRRELVGKLSPHCLKAFSAAAQAAKARGNPYVELAHLVEQLSLAPRSDWAILVEAGGADPGRLLSDTTRAIDGASLMRTTG